MRYVSAWSIRVSKISRQSRLVYICVEYTVWRVIGVWGTSLELKWKRMPSDASVCITFLNRSYQRVLFGYSFEGSNVLIIYRLLECIFEQLDRRYLMRQPFEALGMLLWCKGDLETSVGCWAWLGIDLRGDNSGEKARGCGNAETEQLYPFFLLVLCQWDLSRKFLRTSRSGESCKLRWTTTRHVYLAWCGKEVSESRRR